MSTEKAVAGVVGALLLISFFVGGAMFAFTRALVMRAEEQDAAIPPELEASDRQIGNRTGVLSAALAAWDAVWQHRMVYRTAPAL